jgi:hypothetical protein
MNIDTVEDNNKKCSCFSDGPPWDGELCYDCLYDRLHNFSGRETN